MRLDLSKAHAYKHHDAARETGVKYIPEGIAHVVAHRPEDGRYVIVALPLPHQIQDAVIALHESGGKFYIHG